MHTAGLRGAALRVCLLALMGWVVAGATGAAPGDPVMGNPKAAVRVVIYQDLECPSCAAWHKQLVDSIIPMYSAKVAFEFRDFIIPSHLWSYNAAVIARFFDAKSAKLGLDWRDWCFTHQEDITQDNLIDAAARFGAGAGFTRAQIAAVMSRQDLFDLVNADRNQGTRDHVDHTPFVIVNGTPLAKGMSATVDDLRTALANATR